MINKSNAMIATLGNVTELGGAAVRRVAGEYKSLLLRVDEYVAQKKNEENAKTLKASADEISVRIEKAQTETEDIAEKLAVDIKTSLTQLRGHLDNMRAGE
jgi:hypothetical protein